MQKFKVVRPKQIEGREKPLWLEIGYITEFDNGNRILELNDSDLVYQIFPMEKKETNQQNQDVEDNIPF